MTFIVAGTPREELRQLKEITRERAGDTDNQVSSEIYNYNGNSVFCTSSMRQTPNGYERHNTWYFNGFIVGEGELFLRIDQS